MLGGEIISEADATGRKTKTLVQAAGATLARQTVAYSTSGTPTESIEFEQWDASQMSYRRTMANALGSSDGVNEPGETDPTGTGVGMDGYAYAQASIPPDRDFPMYQPRGFDDVAVNQNGSGVACYEDGFVTSCARAYQNMDDGTAIPSVLGEARRPRQRPTLIPQRPRRPRPPDDGNRSENVWDPAPPVGVRLIFARLGLNSPPQSQPPQNTGGSDPGALAPANDPCPKKGKLDHHAAGNVGISHITPRHIEQIAKHLPNGRDPKSYYTFGSVATNGSISMTTAQRELVVMNLNQEAFEKGGAIPSIRGRIAYVYAPYANNGGTQGLDSVEGFVAGRDRSQNYEATNVRTVVLDGDCKTVITSFPGLPSGVDSNDSRIVGHPHWWNPTYTIPFF